MSNLSQEEIIKAYELNLLLWLKTERDFPTISGPEPSNECIKNRWLAERITKRVKDEFNRTA